MTWSLTQRAIALVAAVLGAPLLGVLAIAVASSSRGGPLYRATRVSRGHTFTMLKLRTMRISARDTDPAVTAAFDPRVTAIGRLLRKTKLDELPQLWNVVRGDMLLVGPRPEDPRYVDWANPLHQLVFSAPPGITGPTALAFRNEEAILAAEMAAIGAEEGRAPAPNDLDRVYRERVLPRKLAMDAEYLKTRTVVGDLRILGRTIRQVLVRTGPT
jgi:lipopolysaccharide/colanic/teichoic acid biosynthesis glycosyltransferase